MSAAGDSADAEIASILLSRATEQELIDLLHKASTPEARLRIVHELGRLRRGDRS